jgi:hypothetical protein
LIDLLTRLGNISFHSNLLDSHDFIAAGGRVVQQPSGHLVLYGSHGRRILATDPDGNPLHECEWIADFNGAIHLARARLRLDWGQWVGLKPGGLINSMVLDLSRKPGWERLRSDDLRHMAAQALQVSLDDIRLFYSDEDLVIDPKGQATIRHRKDAFYILHDGTFDHSRFMACMGAMHWSRIDFLPVVELFQSLLPGTGSAAFELIRGLYDDQNADQADPLPLRYRGTPTYPSEAAFRLFNGFFEPRVSGGRSPFEVFMNPSLSGEVTWLPAANPPRRYFDLSRNLCATVKGSTVQKVTLSDDPAGLPYLQRGPSGGDRSIATTSEHLILMDGQTTRQLTINPSWRPLQERMPAPPTSSASWRDLFDGSPPTVNPAEAFSAVLLYPDDASEIDEVSSVPFVADYLQDLIEESPDLSLRRTSARRTLIDNFDGALQACLVLSPNIEQIVLYTRPAFAQRQAQLFWNRAASSHRLDQLSRTRFVAVTDRTVIHHEPYDWIYRWIPFSSFDQPSDLAETAAALQHSLTPGGYAFVVGPSSLHEPITKCRLRILHTQPVDMLPTFQMHRSILPRARLKPGLTLFHLAV